MLPLAFCSNLLPAETFADLRQQLGPFGESLREQLSWRRLGIDLRVSSKMVHGMRSDLASVREWVDDLRRRGLFITTINAFPLSSFQGEVVKDLAYQPPWPDQERQDATLGLLELAAILCPDQDVITISTVPGTYAGWPTAIDQTAIAAAWGRFAAAAQEHAERGGPRVILCPEPEPWCMLESVAETVDFWRGALLTHGTQAAAAALGNDEIAGVHALRDHVHVCLDTCHVAVAGDDITTAVPTLVSAGALPSKCQVSSCPSVISPALNQDGLDALLHMAEPRFFHQTSLLIRQADGSQGVRRFADLNNVPRQAALNKDVEEIRSHFHVPIHLTRLSDHVGTTQAMTRQGVKQALTHGCSCFSVETYTWSILADEDDQRISGTADELRWLASLIDG
jgi:hypothetical protein